MRLERRSSGAVLAPVEVGVGSVLLDCRESQMSGLDSCAVSSVLRARRWSTCFRYASIAELDQERQWPPLFYDLPRNPILSVVAEIPGVNLLANLN